MKRKPSIRQKVYHCRKQNRKSDFIEVDIFHYTETSRRIRKAKEIVTPPKQQNLNDKNARRYFGLLVKSNFTENDIHQTLTYDSEHKPESIEAAEHEVAKYLRRLKRRYEKAGQKLKYIFVTEFGSRGKVHHHVLLPGTISREEIESCWTLGFANARKIQMNQRGMEQLVNYLQKAAAGKKRWKSSKGLIRPWVTVSDDKYSKRKIEKLAIMPPDCEAVQEYWERQFPDYILYECQHCFNQVTAQWSIYLKMRRRR